MKIVTGLLTAALLAGTAIAVPASATTYIGTRTIGTGSVNISITTDNTVGALTAANILSYTINLINTDATFTLTQSNSSKLISGNAFSATANNLLFDFQAPGFALFQAPSIGSSATFYCLQGQGSSSVCFDTLGAGEAVDAHNNFIFSRVVRTGFQVIASAAAVPEPATWGLMILGFGMIGAASRSRKIKTTVTFA